MNTTEMGQFVHYIPKHTNIPSPEGDLRSSLNRFDRSGQARCVSWWMDDYLITFTPRRLIRPGQHSQQPHLWQEMADICTGLGIYSSSVLQRAIESDERLYQKITETCGSLLGKLDFYDGDDTHTRQPALIIPRHLQDPEVRAFERRHSSQFQTRVLPNF